jgi:hypothetical protein
MICQQNSKLKSPFVQSPNSRCGYGWSCMQTSVDQFINFSLGHECTKKGKTEREKGNEQKHQKRREKWGEDTA